MHISNRVGFRSFVITAWVFALTTALVSAASAAGSLAEKLPMEVIYKAPQPVVMPVSAATGHATLEMPSAPKKPGKVLCIRFRALYPLDDKVDHIQQLAYYYLKMEVNGKEIGAQMPDEADRLLNRGKLGHNEDSIFPWWEGHKMVVFLGHETGEMDPRAISPREEEYWYVLNISDVGEYVWKGVDEMTLGGKPNKIVFSGMRSDSSANPMPKEMRIEDVEMGYLPKETVDKLSPVSTMDVPKLSGTKLKSSGFALTVAPSGAMSIQCGNETYAFRSSYSYPGETAIQFHQFTWDTVKDSDWNSAAVSSGDDVSLSIRGESSNYSVIRKITPKDGKFLIKDTIRNKTDEPLGMAIRYEVATSDHMLADDTYLTGIPGCKENIRCASNPTIFLKNDEGSLGIVAEDDVFGLQLNMIKKGNSVQFGTEHFGVEPQKSYSVEWTLYPSKSTDYWDFINHVRRDWNANVTIPAQFLNYHKQAPGLKATYYICGPWFDCYDGVGLTNDEYLARLKAEVDPLKAAQPDAICMPKLETPAFGLLRNKIPGGDKIPHTPNSLTVELTQEQSDIVKKAAGPLWDSMMKSRKGTAVIDTHYTGKVNSPENLDDFNLNVHPELGNSWYKHMLGQIDLAMDRGGCGGIYMDSFIFAYAINDGGYRADYGQWDGHTVNLDARGQIADKFTDLALVSAPARASIIKYILGKGGYASTNGHPDVRELRSLPYLTFSETDWEYLPDYDAIVKLLSPEKPAFGYAMAAGHLHTPVAGGIAMWRSDLFQAAPKDFKENNQAEINQKYVIACLRNGQLMYPTAGIPQDGPGKGEWGIINEMYPFTPVELHDGYLIGKERIITAVSGPFFWNISDHPQKPSICHAFDNKGYRIEPKSFTVTKVGNQWKVDLQLKQDWMGTAVIL